MKKSAPPVTKAEYAAARRKRCIANGICGRCCHRKINFKRSISQCTICLDYQNKCSRRRYRSDPNNRKEKRQRSHEQWLERKKSQSI